MLTIYDTRGQGLVKREDTATCEQAVWLDLLNPGKEEERLVEQRLGLLVPTREEMAEIEVSSRLYQESGAHFMTATVLHQTDTPDPQVTTITFILTDTRLLTVRYAEPKAFSLFLGRAAKGDTACDTATGVLLGLLEAIIDREADLIERLQVETEKIAHTIFDIKGGVATRAQRFDVLLKQIGKEGVITSKARESLLSLGRLLTYLAQVALLRKESDTVRERIRTGGQDVQSLADHVTYLNARITFMLDALLGMVSIEQNEIIKVFSVVAVMLMPPTLVASIYGMNFKHMPELEWAAGYPLALVLMVLSALLPFLYFRRKGWL
ncbi:MAG TPA: magnesium transporter CorA family protein [Hyphomicrobiaceae bacterium]|nr:magnesium transporter CorA family protein [Hyphomicrobiaceae bacterium]